VLRHEEENDEDGDRKRHHACAHRDEAEIYLMGNCV